MAVHHDPPALEPARVIEKGAADPARVPVVEQRQGRPVQRTRQRQPWIDPRMDEQQAPRLPRQRSRRHRFERRVAHFADQRRTARFAFQHQRVRRLRRFRQRPIAAVRDPDILRVGRVRTSRKRHKHQHFVIAEQQRPRLEPQLGRRPRRQPHAGEARRPAVDEVAEQGEVARAAGRVPHRRQQRFERREMAVHVADREFA